MGVATRSSQRLALVNQLFGDEPAAAGPEWAMLQADGVPMVSPSFSILDGGCGTGIPSEEACLKVRMTVNLVLCSADVKGP